MGNGERNLAKPKARRSSLAVPDRTARLPKNNPATNASASTLAIVARKLAIVVIKIESFRTKLAIVALEIAIVRREIESSVLEIAIFITKLAIVVIKIAIVETKIESFALEF